ncbi:MAG: hypothetical protein ACRDD1_08680, partial [Planctomycetia bacterium]
MVSTSYARLAMVLAVMTAAAAGAVEPNEAALKALRPFDGMVGAWRGEGESRTSSGWNETLVSTWGFRERDGRVSLNFTPAKSDLIALGVLSVDPETGVFKFVFQDAKENVRRFEGKPSGALTLKLPRVDENPTDGFDRCEVKLLRGGDKMIFTFGKKRGSTNYETIGEIQYFRTDAPYEEFKAGPKCVV